MRVEIDGIGLNVEIEGPPEGPVVAFVHGVSGSARTYGWLPPEITAGRRIARIDLRGHGRSDHAPGTYEIDRYGEDVAAVLRQCAGGPAVLVGHSMGAVTAWWVAQQQPELVTAAFLEDPPLYRGEPDEHERNTAIPMFRTLRAQAAGWQADGLDAATAAAQLAAAPLGSRTMGDVMTDDALAARAEALLSMDPGVLDGAADRSSLAGTDTDSPVTVPVLLLAADDALAAFTVRHEQRLAATHPAVEVVRVDGAGHGMHDEREHRATYVEQLERFLGVHAPV